jgi:Fe-S-cluster-containing dehydrogenase component
MMSLEGLLDRGVMQGHEVLLIDTSICIDCDNCVDACGRRHGYSRLERSGLQLGNLLFPSACRHCEDPVCLLCSVNGIVREPDGEIRIVPDNCIGCGACAERCPYDNIQMHDIEDERAKGILSKIIPRKRDAKADPTEGIKQKLAVKCDLCAGYDYYACVHACPVGAAMRVDPVEVFGRNDVLIGLEMKKSGA